MHTPIPLFLSVGVGGIRSCSAYRQFWGVLWGLWAVFWLFVGKHTDLHKFGSQSILRLQNRGVGLWWGWVFLLGGAWWGVGNLSVRLLATAERGCRKSCNNCGKGSGGGCRFSVLGSVAVRPGCPCLACCPAWLGFVLRCCVSGCRLAVRLGCLSW